MEVATSNLVNSLNVASASPRMTNHPWKGRGQVMWIIKIFMGTNHIFGTAEASRIKFCTQVGYIKSQHTDDKSHLKGTRLGSGDPLKMLGPPMTQGLCNGWS